MYRSHRAFTAAQSPRLTGLHARRFKHLTSRSVATAQAVEAVPRQHQQQHAGQDQQPLLEPFKMGGFQLTDRIVYAPLTRCRAINNVPSAAAVEYYSQRARPGGFMISEATVTSPTGYGYVHVPGMHTEEQVAAWKPIVAAVKDKGGVFFSQIWHTGRLSHPDFQPDGAAPLAPSPIAVSGQLFTPTGKKDYPVPKEMKRDDIATVTREHAAAARRAVDAGFDGVEIHSANGYLLDSFLKESSNSRTDEYGGSIDNRARFVLEVAEAVANEIGAERVGIRFSPFQGTGDCYSSAPYGQYVHVLERLNKIKLLYVHIVEQRFSTGAGSDAGDERWKAALWPFRHVWDGVMISAGGHDQASGNEAIASGRVDLVAYGRHYLANPDLPQRFRLHAPLNEYDRSTFYTQDPVVGYTDYPFLDKSTAQQLEDGLHLSAAV